MATMAGHAVDRPAVCFYEINGYDEHPADNDPFNIYSHSSWKPVLDLAREKTDRIVMRSLPWKNAEADPITNLTMTETACDAGGCLVTKTTVRAPGRTLTACDRRHPDINTCWHVEHPLKDADDLRAWLTIPETRVTGEPVLDEILKTEEALGDTGIVMISIGDPLCAAAEMFEMSTFILV
jgi:hypothetical protein